MRHVEAEDIAGDSGPFGSRLVGVGFGLVVFAVLVMAHACVGPSRRSCP